MKMQAKFLCLHPNTAHVFPAQRLSPTSILRIFDDDHPRNWFMEISRITHRPFDILKCKTAILLIRDRMDNHTPQSRNPSGFMQKGMPSSAHDDFVAATTDS